MKELRWLTENLMWLDIGPQKRALLKGHGFNVVGVQFVRPGNPETWTLAFKHVRETPISTLRAELARFPRK
jgi:hypothetical protein